jgi:hypothetical protein
VRRLVWVVPGGESFRVGENGVWLSVAGAPCRLPEGATVGVAHPLEVVADRAAWSRVLGDQPFPQLGRETYEADGPEFKRLVGAGAPASKVVGLERRGWQRSAPMDAGIQERIEKGVGGLTVVVELEPGIEIGQEPGEREDQTLEAIYVREDAAHRLPLEAVGAVAASEVIRDLGAITRDR